MKKKDKLFYMMAKGLKGFKKPGIDPDQAKDEFL